MGVLGRAMGPARRRSRVAAAGVVTLVVLAAGCNLGVPVKTYEVPVSTDKLASLGLGDVNGDGHADLVATGIERYGVLLGDGTGNFTVARVGVPATGIAGSMALGDIGGDGKLDLVYVGVVQGRIEVRRGDGTGGFS